MWLDWKPKLKERSCGKVEKGGLKRVSESSLHCLSTLTERACKESVDLPLRAFRCHCNHTAQGFPASIRGIKIRQIKKVIDKNQVHR